MKSVAILLNPDKQGALALAREMVPWFHARSISVVAEQSAASAIDQPSIGAEENKLKEAEFAVVMGGDGTLLRASHTMAPAGVPMFAIRFGTFGFLADTDPENAFDALETIIAGDFCLDERMMLQTSVERNGSASQDLPPALNDSVIAKGPLSRMLNLDTHVSGQYISTYAADGLIAATPTGSTAYSLSAGGPLVAPSLKTIIITPICPHTLNARAMLIASDESVEVVISSGSGDTVMLTIDGQYGVPLEAGDKIRIRQADCYAKLISFGRNTFCEKLQTRLRWGDRFDDE